MEGETLTFAEWSAGEGAPPLDAVDDPDRWQPLLPMPYRMVDELLTEMLDEAMFRMHLQAEARRNLNPAQIVDDESGAAAVSPPLVSVPLPADIARAPVAQLCHLEDGAVAAALEASEEASAASLWLWDVEATVQEALASDPLETILEHKHDEANFDEWEQWGNEILTTAVFSIILTAPLGMLIINILGPRWLTQDVDPEAEKSDALAVLYKARVVMVQV